MTTTNDQLAANATCSFGPKIDIISYHSCDASFMAVHLTTKAAPDCFVEGTSMWPNEHCGFNVHVDLSDERALQAAGRTIAAAGLNKVKVTTSENDLRFDVITATQFVLAMYSDTLENSGFSVALELDVPNLEAVRRNVSIITLGRVFANSPNNIYHTTELLEVYFKALEQAFTQNKGQGQLSFKIYKAGDALFDDNCVGLKTVGQSSAYEPCLGVVDYIGPGADENKVDIALVGKGIAFDTGGYDLKPSNYMQTMHTDKSGMIYMAAATILAGAMGAGKHVRCYMPCAENRISANSMVTGDIITYPNGVKVEIGNTDAEGRLILADALILASKDQPKFILDSATLTGAAKIAVGRDMCAVLSRSNKMDPQLEQAFNYTKEEYWLLPLREYHKRYIKAKRATIANTSHGDGAPGASTAAAFLSYFVDPNIKWTHIDLSNAYNKESSPYLGTGSTGSTILAIAHWLVGSQY